MIPPALPGTAPVAAEASGESSTGGSPTSPHPPVMAPMTPPVSAAEETHPSNVANGVGKEGQTTQQSARGRKRKGTAAKGAETDKEGQGERRLSLRAAASDISTAS